MKKEIACVLFEQGCELVVGLATSIVLKKTILPKYDKKEQTIIVLGGIVGAWHWGRKFGKEFYKFTDETLGTKFYEADND